MENNRFLAKMPKINLIGFFVITALPLLVIPPWFYPVDWGKTVVFRSIVAILLFLFACQFLWKRNEINLPNIKQNKIIWVLAALGVAILLSVLFSVDRNFSLWGSPYRAGGAVTLLFYGVFALLAFFTIKKPDWPKLLNASIGVGVLVSLIAIIQFYSLLSDIFIAVPGRPPGTMGNPILLAIYLVLLFFITLSLALKESRRSWQVFYYGALILFAAVILMTGSRAAYLGLLAGAIYFALAYPKKLPFSKWWIVGILGLGIALVAYANITHQFPRLSLSSALNDPRFSAWKVGFEALQEKPIFGWGPENFNIGFDKYYDPSLPYISKAWGGWWDRPHNILLDVATSSGIPAALLYLALFGVLFWQLQRAKKTGSQLTIHALQATLIAYLVANFFSFDGFSSYLLFFFLIGYALHLTSAYSAPQLLTNTIHTPVWKKGATGVLALVLIIFLWNYNAKPFFINAKVQNADILSESKKCDQAFALIDQAITSHSFLDAYSRIQYIEYLQTCAGLFPEKNVAYAKKGVSIMQEAVKARPQYSRLWLFLGSFTVVQATGEQNPAAKQTLISQAHQYFAKAQQLAPKHQEVIIEQAKADLVIGDYETMKERAAVCAALDDNLGDCYWIKAAAEIYMKDLPAAQADIEAADDREAGAPKTYYLQMLANAYTAIENYPGVIASYKELIKARPEFPQYRASIAFAYYKIGDYVNARKEALKFIELMPGAKAEGEDFLKLLPN